MDLVSVACATYNGERFLSEQLDSIVGQDYPEVEVVACDDASQDRTRSILEAYAKRYPAFRVVSNDRRLGYIGNFEKAVSLCTGRYIALCDQDDVWEPQKLSELVARIKRSALVHSDAAIIDETGQVVAASYTRAAGKDVVDSSFAKLLVRNAVTGCTALFHRDLLGLALPFPRAIPHDHWLAIAASTSPGGLIYHDEALTRYRQHGGNAIGAKITLEARPVERRRLLAPVRFDEEKRDAFVRRYARYTEISKQFGDRLSPRDRRTLDDIILYYRSYFGHRLRPGAFMVHLKYARYFNEGRGTIAVIRKTLSSLFGDVGASLPDA